MFENITRYFKDIDVIFIKSVTTSTIIFFISISTAYYTIISHALNTYKYTIVKQLEKQIHNEQQLVNTDFYIENNIYLLMNEKLFNLNDYRFKPTNFKSLSTGIISFNIGENIELHFPSFIQYNLENYVVFVDISFENKTMKLISLIILITFILSAIIFHTVLQTKLRKLHKFKISAQEYALAERTTSYLVSIMHHKLNTPLKVLSTKTRVLAQIINNSDLDDEIKDRASDDLILINQALKNIFEITTKLRSFNTASQTETNVYKIFETAIELIEILRDDEFTITVDIKTKLFNIYTDKLTSHELIQVFINQIKFSLEEMSDEISIKVLSYDVNTLKILFSDNGNIVDNKIIKLIKNKKLLNSLNPDENNEYYSDLILNLNILEESGGSLNIISSNKNGTTYEIVIPAKTI